jgi:rubrerythrin
MLLNRRQFLFVLSSAAFLRGSLTEASGEYSGTIAALKRAYANEIQAHLNYLAFADKAKTESYPGIAHFFVCFATSESVHAQNFKEVLSGLGVYGWEPPKPEVKIFSTRVNLRNALDFEIEDIDQRYPRIYEESKPEKHETALRNIVYAWESEKQHRDLIEKMQSGTGIFFGLLTRKIEAASARFFVCHICGSTMIRLPEESCSICKHPVSAYKEVARSK